MNKKKKKKIELDLIDLFEKELNENPAILGINVGTHGGSLIASKFKKGINLTDVEISAAASSLLFLSSKMLLGSLNQSLSYNITSGKNKIILSFLTENVTIINYLDRELAELERVQSYISKLKKFALHVSAIIETSDIIKEEIFVAIKRAIPNALVLAIITKEGLPIKIQSTMPESMISAMTSAIYKISDVLLEGSLEYSIISGENGSIILHELDEMRLLCIAVPEASENKLGAYIAKIKTIIARRN